MTKWTSQKLEFCAHAQRWKTFTYFVLFFIIWCEAFSSRWHRAARLCRNQMPNSPEFIAFFVIYCSFSHLSKVLFWYIYSLGTYPDMSGTICDHQELLNVTGHRGISPNLIRTWTLLRKSDFVTSSLTHSRGVTWCPVWPLIHMHATWYILVDFQDHWICFLSNVPVHGVWSRKTWPDGRLRS